MSNEKDIGFVQQLVEATNTGKVSWQPTARIDEFTISFKGRFSLIIARPSQGYFVFRMLDEGDRVLTLLGDPEVMDYMDAVALKGNPYAPISYVDLALTGVTSFVILIACYAYFNSRKWQFVERP